MKKTRFIEARFFLRHCDVALWPGAVLPESMFRDGHE